MNTSERKELVRLVESMEARDRRKAVLEGLSTCELVVYACRRLVRSTYSIGRRIFERIRARRGDC